MCIQFCRINTLIFLIIRISVFDICSVRRYWAKRRPTIRFWERAIWISWSSWTWSIQPRSQRKTAKISKRKMKWSILRRGPPLWSHFVRWKINLIRTKFKNSFPTQFYVEMRSLYYTANWGKNRVSSFLIGPLIHNLDIWHFPPYKKTILKLTSKWYCVPMPYLKNKTMFRPKNLIFGIF